MRMKILTFRYSETLGGFDDTALVEFIRDKTVLSSREHFYGVSDVPHITCVLAYQEPLASGDEAPSRGTRPVSPRVDPSTGLGERDRILFNTLREWRAGKAKEEGVPRYVILTNRELVQVVLKKPETPTALAQVPGIGPAKIKKYGHEILSWLNGPPDVPEKLGVTAVIEEDATSAGPAS